MKHRRVLVAMDGSENSERAFKYFQDVVHVPDDYVIIVYVPEFKNLVHVPVMTADAGMMAHAIDAEQKEVRLFLGRLKEMLKMSKMKGNVKQLHGEAGPQIVDAAAKEGAEFIVVGSRGLGTIRRTLMGSVSDYIVHHSTVPVFVVRHE